MLALALVSSVLALAAGLGLVVAGRDRPRVRLAIDGFILGVVPTLLVVHVVPHLWGQLGILTPIVVVTGYGSFWLIEHAAERQTLRERVVVTVLALHSLLDGASLGVAPGLHLGRASGVLMAALVIHRLPEGLVLGALLIPRYGFGTAAKTGAVLALLTLTGALGGGLLIQHADGWLLALVAAGSMGALLRAVLHGHAASSRSWATMRVLGALLGAALTLAVPEVP